MTSKKKNKLIKIRQNTESYWVYFLELRKIISVNAKGTQILDLYFNKEASFKEISNNTQKTLKEVKNFLKKIKNNLNSNKNKKTIKNDYLKVPISAEIQINSKCNLRCKHCFQDDYTKSMSLKTLKSDLDILDKAGIFEIELTGGEPFLHPDILEVINYCCEKPKFALNITTNGTLLNKKIVNKISDFNNNISFLVSLDGTRDINDKIRGKGVFKKVDRTLKLLKKYGFYVEISFTVNKLNLKNTKDIIKYANSLNVSININLFKPFYKNQEKFSITPKEYFDLIDQLFIKEKLHKRGVNLNNKAIFSYVTDNQKVKTCKATISSLNIDVNNKMVPCPLLCLAGGCDEKKIPQFNENFLDKWQKNYCFKKFRQGNFYQCQATSHLFNKSNKDNPYSLKSYIKYKAK